VSRPKVVILGAGFGGLTAARALDRIAEVTLVDRHNFQTFLPLLYQVSTAGLAADHVAYPIRGALRKTLLFRLTIKIRASNSIPAKFLILII
jgi:NADH dehydrogenase